MTPNWYEILQVSPKADPEVVEAAYQRLSLKRDGVEHQQLLDQAFAIVGDATRRAEYDRALATNGALAAEAVAPVAAGVAAPAVAQSVGARIVQCPQDPGVETALRCSRCEKPICPRCLVQTPVGARCRECARIVRSPVYTLNEMQTLRAALASVIGGLVMGTVWLLVLRPFTIGFLSIFVGAGLGYVFTRLLDLATGRKRGPLVVTFALVGIGIAWAMQVVFLGFSIALYGLVAVGVAAYYAYQSLR
jgi:hypothetical protein